MRYECFKLAFSGKGVKAMGNVSKDDALYQEMCRVVGKVVLEMRDLGQEPKHIVIAGNITGEPAREAK